MKTSFFSVKEFNANQKSAKAELNETFKSPFVICNLLNKAANGDFSKVKNCEGITRENLAVIASDLRARFGNRYAFTFDVLVESESYFKDIFGRLCYAAKAEQNELPALLCGETVTDPRGNELRINADGVVIVCKPVALTIPAFFNAFCKVAKVDISTKVREQRAAEKAAKADAKRAALIAKATAIVSGVFGEIARTFTEDEMIAKYEIIRKAK